MKRYTNERNEVESQGKIGLAKGSLQCCQYEMQNHTSVVVLAYLLS